MIIVWPNSDGTITLSQRTASGNVEPDSRFELDAGSTLTTHALRQNALYSRVESCSQCLARLVVLVRQHFRNQHDIHDAIRIVSIDPRIHVRPHVGVFRG